MTQVVLKQSGIDIFFSSIAKKIKHFLRSHSKLNKTATQFEMLKSFKPLIINFDVTEINEGYHDI